MTADRLEEMLTLQRATQAEVYGHDVSTMRLHERLAYIRDMVLAAEHELHEALDETSWKTWDDQNTVRVQTFMEELTDAWCFLMNLMLATGLPPEQLATHLFVGYLTKRKLNLQRHMDDRTES